MVNALARFCTAGQRAPMLPLVFLAATFGATATAVARAEILRPVELRAARVRTAALDLSRLTRRPRDCDAGQPAGCRMIVIDLP